MEKGGSGGMGREGSGGMEGVRVMDYDGRSARKEEKHDERVY